MDDTHLAVDEHDLLTRFLADVRATVIRKTEGLSDEDARRPGVPSGTSIGGLVKHLTWVERWWFGSVGAGREIEFPWTDDDPDADMRMEPGETLAELVADYRAAVAESEAILAGGRLDDPSTRAHPRRGHVQLRWIGWHLVEETARHNGHLDIVREQIDGVIDEA